MSEKDPNTSDDFIQMKRNKIPKGLDLLEILFDKHDCYIKSQ